MAMTKAEKTRMEELETALALCWPPYPCPQPMTPEEIRAAPKVKTGDGSYMGEREAVPGFFYNAYNAEISSGFSTGHYHSRSGGGSWSQSCGSIYRTKREAAMAMRHEISRTFAKKLAAVDRIIAEESTNA